MVRWFYGLWLSGTKFAVNFWVVSDLPKLPDTRDSTAREIEEVEFGSQ